MDEFKVESEMHGLMGKKHWPPPTLVTHCDVLNRENNKCKAHEYLDDAQVLDQKVTKIAKLIRKSNFVVAYTGAGLSKASGIPDYATKSENSLVKGPKLISSLDATPTYSHHILKRMNDANFLHYWVQQNHDGLPQKAGYPQEKINEIHGAWFDPSNRVVKFSGNLRSDLFDDLIQVESKTDLCLCLGTSLSGMNSDRIAFTPAQKRADHKGQGTVIVNLQKTRLDGMSSIRVWAKLDDVFELLAKKLEIDHSIPQNPFAIPPFPADQTEFCVPYNKHGKLDQNRLMKWNLSAGEKVEICHPDASNFRVEGTIRRKEGVDYYWSVVLPDKNGEMRTCRLGWWMIDAALRGTLPYLPFRNFPTVQRN